MTRQVQKRLHRALETQRPVEIIRSHIGKRAEKLSGLVLSVGTDWFAVAALSQAVYLDGWEVLRITDVRSVVPESKSATAYIERALDVLGPAPELPDALRFPAAKVPGSELLLEILAANALVGIHEEMKHPDALRVGSFVGRRGAKIGLRQIGSSGKWDAEVTAIKLSKITRVTVGGRYQDALARFGEPLPPLE
jgi:hypothetical protein